MWDLDQKAFVCDHCGKVHPYGNDGPHMPDGWRFVMIGREFYHYHYVGTWDHLLHFCCRSCWGEWLYSEYKTFMTT